MRSSPERGSFQAKHYPESLAKMIEDQRANTESAPDWKTNNLEYDLRTNNYIWKKCKNDVYAQNLYAALCNNEFVKNDVWPLLKGDTWGCSWRYAGGIIADIREEGDYIDWYCSGTTREELNGVGGDYVREGEVTDQIRQDLKSIGWIVCDTDSDQ